MATSRRPNVKSAAVLPADVRLMNGVAAVIVSAVLLALAWQAVKWATRSPVFTVRAIALDARVGAQQRRGRARHGVAAVVG